VNTLITPTAVAKMSLIALLNNWVFGGLVYKDYSKEFKKVGESVKVRKPISVDAVEFDGDLTGQFQNVTEEYVEVPMDTILTVPLQVGAKQLTQEVESFYGQFVEPAVQAIADAVDVKLARLYKDIPYYYDITETNVLTIVQSLLGGRQVLGDNKAPQRGRVAVMSPLTTALLLSTDPFRDLDKTGQTTALREASLGRIFGFDFFENQNIQTHAIGSATVAGAIDSPAAADYPVGTATIHIDGLGATDTYAKGSILVITGVAGHYVLTADTTCSGGEADFPIYPALEAVASDGDVVTFHAAATTSKENLLFHKNCFAMVSAPLEPPLGGAKGATVAYNGISMNVVYDYVTPQFKNLMTISLLCGFKTLTPELGCRLYDAS